MRKNPTVTEELSKALSTRGHRAKYEFYTEAEAKHYWNKLKSQLDKLPEFLKPKL